jgi:hypothetical protein
MRRSQLATSGRAGPETDRDASRGTRAAPTSPSDEPARAVARDQERVAGWDHIEDPTATSRSKSESTTAVPLAARILSLFSDPRVDSITADFAGTALSVPRQDVETALDGMTQAGRLVASGGAVKRYSALPQDKQRLEQEFRAAARELGEHGVLAVPNTDEALAVLEDDVEEPRLPVTAGLLSLFLPGTGQLLNGDVGRAALVFAVWSLAWITNLSPVWTFVSLYAGAEAFFTAKIRSMERKLAREAGARGRSSAGPHALPPKPSSPGA